MRGCGRIDVGRSAGAAGWGFVVWFGLVVGIEVVRRGRVMVMVKRIMGLRWRESIVDWRS